MKIVAIMQPTYLPWIGYFDLIDQVDQFVLLDNVQLAKRSWQVRNRIKTSQGDLFLTVSIKKKEHRADILIKNAEINYEENWTNKHLKSLEFNYKKAAYFREVYDLIYKILSTKHKYLARLNIDIIHSVSKKIGQEVNFIRSSEFKEISGEKDKRLVEICKRIDAKEYLSPQGSAVYMERMRPGGEFVKEKIELFYHNFKHPIYHQLFNGFISHLCILDLLFNYGFDNSLEIIRKGRRPKIYFESYNKTYLKLKSNNSNTLK